MQRKAQPSEEDRSGESPEEDAAGNLDVAISETTVDFLEARLGEESLLLKLSIYLSIISLISMETDFCYLKPKVLHNTFGCFPDMLGVNVVLQGAGKLCLGRELKTLFL